MSINHRGNILNHSRVDRVRFDFSTRFPDNVQIRSFSIKWVCSQFLTLSLGVDFIYLFFLLPINLTEDRFKQSAAASAGLRAKRGPIK